MEPKIKKTKSSKKRKAEESLEGASLDIAISTTSPPPPVAEEPRKKTKASKRAKSPILTPTASDAEGDAPAEPPSKKRKSSIEVEEIEVDITLPEPPSKKALRRLKKGKPLPPSKSGADTSPEPEDSKPKKAEVEKRSEYGIWIGNLPWGISKADLRTFLTSNSEIEDDGITRIHMPSPDDGKPANRVEEVKPWKKQHNKGFAYVDFAVPEAVQQAVELSEQLLGGRRVLIKDNKSFEGRPQKTKEETRNEGKLPSKRVFLGNLRFDTTEDSLKEHFEKCGAIEKVMVATFEDSGKCKGYAWITFEELSAAESAVRGYVLEPEEEESDSDSEAEDVKEDGGESGDEGVVKGKKKPKKPRMKKRFVDKIHTRPVRREFAEDAQVRYKKRYGKDGTKNKSGENGNAEGETGGNSDGEKRRVERVRPIKEVEYRTPYAARLTGGIVESKGKKVVF